MVLDASAAVAWLLRLPLGDAVSARFVDADEMVHAPHLLAVEVAQVVRRYVQRGEISDTRAQEALADLADLDVVRHGHEPLLASMWLLRANLTAYDAAYVALAEVLHAPLVTLDARLARTPGHDARIDLVA